MQIAVLNFLIVKGLGSYKNIGTQQQGCFYKRCYIVVAVALLHQLPTGRNKNQKTTCYTVVTLLSSKRGTV